MDNEGFFVEVKNKRIEITFEEFFQFTELSYKGSNLARTRPESAWIKSYDKEEARRVLLVENAPEGRLINISSMHI